MQESKTRKRREERIRKPIAPDDDDEDWETVTRPGKQMTIQVGMCVVCVEPFYNGLDLQRLIA